MVEEAVIETPIDTPEVPETPEIEPEQLETPDPESPEIEATPEPEDESIELTSLSQLPDLLKQFDPDLDIDESALLGLKIKDKVNGEEVEFSIADAISTHRQNQAAGQRLSEAKEKSRAIIEEATQVKESWRTGVQAVNKLIETLESEMTREFRSSDLEKLKATDKAAYAVKRQELADRKEKIAALRAEAAQVIDNAKQTQQQELEAAWNKKREEEFPKLVERIPDFADEEKARAIDKELTKNLIERGFSPDEIGLTVDHRMIEMAYEAMLYRKSKSKLATAKKKVVKVPRITKPGASQSRKPNGADRPKDRVSILYGKPSAHP